MAPFLTGGIARCSHHCHALFLCVASIVACLSLAIAARIQLYFVMSSLSPQVQPTSPSEPRTLCSDRSSPCQLWVFCLSSGSGLKSRRALLNWPSKARAWCTAQVRSPTALRTMRKSDSSLATEVVSFQELVASIWRLGTAVSTMRNSSRPRVFRRLCVKEGEYLSS